MIENPVQVARQMLLEFLGRGGYEITKADLTLLSGEERSVEALSEQEKQVVRGWGDALLKGFFDAAADGYAAVPVDLIKRRFRRSLEENYPGANSAFLGLATTYWTMKLVAIELREASPDGLMFDTFGALEARVIGPLFFPVSGPLTIGPEQRERDQRAFLQEYGGRTDIEALMRGNPILIRDRANLSPRGCFGGLVLISPGLVFLILIISGMI